MYKYNTCLLASILDGGAKGFFHKVSYIFIIFNVYDGRNNIKYIYIGRMIKWLCVCFWIHVIHTQQSLTTSSFSCICMYLVVYYVYVVNLCLWLHNLKKCVITLKVHNVKTFAMSSKSLSWRQKHVMTSITRHNVKYTSKIRKVRHDVKTFVTKSKYDDAMTSKTCHDIKKVRYDITQHVLIIFWSRNNEKIQSERQKCSEKISHEVKKCVRMSTKCVMLSKRYHYDVNKCNTLHDVNGLSHHKFVMMSKSSSMMLKVSSLLQKFVITSQSLTWRKKDVMMSQSLS